MATMRTGIIWMVMMVTMCMVTSSRAYVIHGRNEAETTPSADQTDYEEIMLSEMMTSEEEVKVDAMFPAQMRDDLKLELILKALVILKTFEGETLSVPAWLPHYDVMPEVLKLKLILKAIVLLKNKAVHSRFAGHSVGELKLTLILKVLRIIHDSKTDLGLVVDKGNLKLALLLKAIHILKVYHGEFKDTVFFTETKEQLKLELILKAITLLKHGNWPIDIDFWPMGEEEEVEEEESSQSEATTAEQTTREFPEQQTTTNEGAINETVIHSEPSTEKTEYPTTEQTTSTVMTERQGSRNRGDIPIEKRHLPNRGISKVYKWLKWLPKVIHKKKHHIFH